MVFDNLCSYLSERFETLVSNARHIPDQKYHPTLFKEICRDFLRELHYVPQDGGVEETNTLYQTLLSEFSSYDDDGGTWFKTLCRESADFAQLSYSHTSEEVRLQVARYTWYLFYIDDLGQKLPSSLEEFQECVFAKKNPQGAFLQDLREHLADMYRLWEPIPANCIITSALEFVSGCVMEQMPTIRDMRISPKAGSWPYYLRKKTGLGTAYAFFLFPMELQIDMSNYIQVIEDIMTFIMLANDVLSFYKEELAGETGNYVHNVSYVNQKSITATLRDVAKDTLDAHQRVCEVLRGTPVYAPWIRFVNGYLDFHCHAKRYELQDIGLVES